MRDAVYKYRRWKMVKQEVQGARAEAVGYCVWHRGWNALAGRSAGGGYLYVTGPWLPTDVMPYLSHVRYLQIYLNLPLRLDRL